MFNDRFQSMSRSAAAEQRTGMFCLGGVGRAIHPVNFDAILLTVESYHPLTNAWTEHRGMPEPGRTTFGAWGFGADGALIAGGVGAVDVAPDQEGVIPIVARELRLLHSILRFIAKETWSWARTWLASPRSLFGTSVIRGVGYAYGGLKGFSGGSAKSDSIFGIRPATASAQFAKGTLPTGRSGATAGTIGEKGYMAGGSFELAQADRRAIYQWNPATEAVTTTAGTLLRTLRQQAGGAVGDSLHVFGGRAGGVRGLSDLNQRYTPATDTTISKAPTSGPAVHNATSFIDLGGIYQIGGQMEEPEFENGLNTVNTNRVTRYDVFCDSWATRQSPAGVCEPSSVARMVGMADPNLRWGWAPNGPARYSAAAVNI